MKLTRGGDANLDRTVDFTDLVTLARNYNTTGSQLTWDQGDFNYDDKVDFNDLVLLARNYNQSFPASAVPGAPADFAADLAAAFATVPEPSGAVTLLLAACAGMTARRRPRRPARRP
jgi:hypothetical protein